MKSQGDEFRTTHGQAAVEGDPDSANGIGHHGAIASYTLDSLKTIRDSVGLNIRLTERSSQQSITIHPEHMVRGGEPKEALESSAIPKFSS